MFPKIFLTVKKTKIYNEYNLKLEYNYEYNILVVTISFKKPGMF